MKRVIVVLMAALLLTGCSAPGGDNAYLSVVREGVPALAELSDEELTELAQQVCGVLDDRGFEDGMAEFIRLAKETGLTAGEAGHIAGAAAGAYCTEHAENF